MLIFVPMRHVLYLSILVKQDTFELLVSNCKVYPVRNVELAEYVLSLTHKYLSGICFFFPV